MSFLYAVLAIYLCSLFGEAKTSGTAGTDGKRGYSEMHSNPEAFHLMNRLSLTPKINAVYGDIAHTVLTTVYARELARGLPRKGLTYKLLGVGSGACNLEIDIARRMVHHHFKKGERMVVYCYDPSNEGYESARASIHQVNHTESRVKFVAVQELPTLVRFHGVFAHHSLHHVSDLEGLYEYIEKSMHIDGVFFAADMTGRNGHRRWPEQLALADKLWNEQPTPGHAWDYIKNVSLDEYPDYDYSHCNGQPGIALEGIRSEEVLPLLEQYFYFDKFVGFGGLAHEYVGRRLGDNYKTDTEEGRAFIHKLYELQESATNDNIIKPDQFFASMRRMDSKAKLNPPKYYGNITVQFAVRVLTHVDDGPSLDPCQDPQKQPKRRKENRRV